MGQVYKRGTCTPGYYAYVSTWGCCPHGFDCTAAKSTKTYHYHTSTSEKSAPTVGQIIGYSISGVVGFIFLALFMVTGYLKCTKQSCDRPGQVGEMDTQTGGQNSATTSMRY
ncbi:uncharacterized protein LOC134697961 [Mytilus trossulus]|uniref:uncharacterized protein LOC134697961 n=1 Tax=Mytilus trossulus TaxID=6551 RepID=UPI0030075906